METKRQELNEQINSLKEIRIDIGMNRREFSEYIGIPLRTLEEWEAGRRKMPDYVLKLLLYQVKMEKFLKENEIQVPVGMREEKWVRKK